MNLAAEMGKLPEPPNNFKPPHWNYWRWVLWDLAQEDLPTRFCSWPPVYHCMLVDHWRGIIESVEIPYVDSKVPNFRQEIQPFNTSDFLNHIHQAYHLLRWQDATGLRIADMQSIYEFGGGYGAMALVARRMGFTGKYYIYDLPEFTLLQQWYLGECGVDGVEWKDGLDTMQVDLLIACYSLSETDFTERDRFLTRTWSKNYLFLYSNKFEDYDNMAYFQRPGLAKHLYDHEWAHSHIAHLPPESWYTFGWSENASQSL